MLTSAVLLFLFASSLVWANNYPGWKEGVKLRKGNSYGELTTKNAEALIFSPRNYSVAIYVTMTANCPYCHVIDPGMKKIHETLQKLGDAVPLFLVYASQERSMSLLQRLKAQKVPSVLYLSPSPTGKIAPETFTFYSQNVYQEVTAWLEKVSGQELRAPKPLAAKVARQVLSLLLVVAALAAVAGAVRFVYLYGPFHYLLYFVVIVGGVFGATQAGVVWNITRRPPWAGYDSNHDRLSYVADGGQQFIAEGILISALQTATATSLLIICALVPQIKSSLLKRFSFYTLYALFFACVIVLAEITCHKTHFSFCSSYFWNENVFSVLSLLA